MVYLYLNIREKVYLTPALVSCEGVNHHMESFFFFFFFIKKVNTVKCLFLIIHYIGVLTECRYWWLKFTSVIKQKSEQNGCHFDADNIFRCIFLKENVCILIQFSENFVLRVLLDNKSALVQIMVWCPVGDMLFPELMSPIQHHVFTWESSFENAVCSFRLDVLTHQGQDKMAAIFQTTFWSVFSWMKMYEFRLTFHWSLSPRVQLTILQHWFR